MKIKCLIIDDEELARDLIEAYIEKMPQLELVGSYNSPIKAIETISNKDVDLIGSIIGILRSAITDLTMLQESEKEDEVQS